jgi:hypothetical protein
MERNRNTMSQVPVGGTVMMMPESLIAFVDEVK